MSGEASYLPGASLLRPYPLIAAAVMVVNLVYLKGAHPGWISGKLSDFAICFFLPVVFVSLFEWAAYPAGRRGPAERPVIAAACLVTVLYFSALQLVPFVAEMHVRVLGAVTVGVRRFAVTPDPTDLIALPMSALAYLWLRRESLRRSVSRSV